MKVGESREIMAYHVLRCHSVTSRPFKKTCKAMDSDEVWDDEPDPSSSTDAEWTKISTQFTNVSLFVTPLSVLFKGELTRLATAKASSPANSPPSNKASTTAMPPSVCPLAAKLASCSASRWPYSPFLVRHHHHIPLAYT
jgi:hypothetical protein